jgi:gluconate 2-dehydrogenase gamma chain
MSAFSFTTRQLSTLCAAADRIIPPDETAGAAEAGAAEFILRLLNNELIHQQTIYAQGLDEIEKQAQTLFNQSFADLSTSDQDAILKTIERTNATFFRMLVEHTLEGFYADPSNGGNRDAISWKMIGFRAEGGAA